MSLNMQLIYIIVYITSTHRNFSLYLRTMNYKTFWANCPNIASSKDQLTRLPLTYIDQCCHLSVYSHLFPTLVPQCPNNGLRKADTWHNQASYDGLRKLFCWQTLKTFSQMADDNCNAALVHLISTVFVQQRVVPETRMTDKEWGEYL
jgi:hypothetical protein